MLNKGQTSPPEGLAAPRQSEETITPMVKPLQMAGPKPPYPNLTQAAQSTRHRRASGHNIIKAGLTSATYVFWEGSVT